MNGFVCNNNDDDDDDDDNSNIIAISITSKIMLHRQQCFSKLPKLSETIYGTLLSANLYTVICQIARSFGAKKLTNSYILLFQLNFVPTGNTPNINVAK